MTVSRPGPAIDAPDIDTAIVALRQRGLRASAARRLVLEALYEAEQPVSAEAIAAGLDGRVPRSDPASVYRNLETLEQVGLVRHFHLGHGPGLYVRAGDAREYLLCDSCGAVTAVDADALDQVRDLVRRDFGLEARFSHFPLVGLCASCSPAATEE